ncbi:MAG TPA: class I SAM-dependent methyltransferase [Labilithrix sp.]|nr:class I SAM-dependent methyltransferase [Labilithrix sp.]
MTERTLEPEVMDTPEEAHDYDAMDHAAVNEQFCADLLAQGAPGATVLDVGTGTALIPIALATRAPNCRVVGVDLAENMLALAKLNIQRAGFQNRVTVEKVDEKRMPYDDGAFATTISNSIVHHIPDPRTVFAEMRRVTASGGLIFVRDLARPKDDDEVDRLVALYGGEPPEDSSREDSSRTERFERQRNLLRDSLKAALTVDEATEMAASAGLAGASVCMTSDRHWTLSYRKP